MIKRRPKWVSCMKVLIQGSTNRRGPRLRECCRQVEAEVVSKSRNKIHQTQGPPISGALYCGFETSRGVNDGSGLGRRSTQCASESTATVGVLA